MHYLIFLILTIGTLTAEPATLETSMEPDAYSSEGYCIVRTFEQKVLGLNRFKTPEAFQQKCNGKMIFEYEEERCRFFISNKMHFAVLLSDQHGTYLLDRNSSHKACGKSITETLINPSHAQP